MKYLSKAMLAALVFAAPAQAHASEWWLVIGEPGDDMAKFADSASIVAKGNLRTIAVANHWRDGRSVTRKVSIRCDEAATSAIARFTCGDDAYRTRTAMLVGEMGRETFARVLFSVPTARKAQAKVVAN